MFSTTDLAWIVPASLAFVGLVFATGRWYSSVNSDRANFKEFMDEVRQDVKEILARLPPTPVTGSSPLQLTDFGERMSEWLDAPEWAKGVAVTVELPDQAEPFQLDEIARRYVHEQVHEAAIALIAKCAYEFGTEHGAVREVLRVVLRDELLKRADEAA